MSPADEVWKSASLVRTFLDGVRGGIPFAATHIDVMLRILSATGRPLARWRIEHDVAKHLRRKLRELE